jgi:polysaccharide biosynthesis protein PelD
MLHPVLPPVQALIELAVLMALIAIADWALPGLDIAALEPSPYWLPVLLLSLQYGTIAGLLAAAAATVAHVLNGFPEQSIGENLFPYLLRIWALPMLWIGVALLLGQFRLRQIEVKRTLRRDLEQRTLEAQTLAGYAKDLEDRCRRLERHVSSGQSIAINSGRMPASLAALDALAPLTRSASDLAAGLDGIATAVMPGASLSVFAVTPAGCGLVVASGWPETAPWKSEIPAAHPLYRAMTGERRGVSVLNRGDEAILGSEGLAACPIFAPDSGRVIGILKLEAADASYLTRATPEHLATIARLVAPALGEPRIVVDNSARAVRTESAVPSRLTRGWRQVAWRDAGLSESVAHGAPVQDEDADERSPRPKRLS